MAKFYFNISDNDGMTGGDLPYEYPTLADAVAQAKTVLSEMALDGIPRDDGSRLAVEVVDMDRRPLVTVSIVLRIDRAPGGSAAGTSSDFSTIQVDDVR